MALYGRIRGLLSRRRNLPLLLLAINLALFVASLALLTPQIAAAQGASTIDPEPESLMAAAVAMAGSAIGSGLAVYGAASAGAAAIAERPAVATWVIILAGLGEGIAIYGLIIAIVIIGKA